MKRFWSLLKGQNTMRPTVYGRLFLLTCTLGTAAPFASATDFVYAQTTETMSYSGVPSIPINGLSINLPAASQLYNTAVVTLNMPNLYLTNGCSSDSATITLVGDSPVGVVFGVANVGCDTAVAKSAQKPVTIVLKVALGKTAGAAFADWQAAPSSTINTATFASISAILVRE